jgi:hypothetical protein
VEKDKLKISFDVRGTETCLEVAAPKTTEYVAALTESLRITNVRAKVQYTVKKPTQFLARIRVSEFDGSALTPSRASELLRAVESQLRFSEQERSRAA